MSNPKHEETTHVGLANVALARPHQRDCLEHREARSQIHVADLCSSSN